VDSSRSVAAITLASPNERTGESHERKSVIIPGWVHWVCCSALGIWLPPEPHRAGTALARPCVPRRSATGPLLFGIKCHCVLSSERSAGAAPHSEQLTCWRRGCVHGDRLTFLIK
jgi:hypothetical protein